MSDETMAVLPTTTVLPVDGIKPYFNNPRKISDQAVEAVRKSLENYGYLQPIVVDADHVVIVGHTRLRALQEMGVTEVPVYVSPMPESKAREYRLVDNKTSETTAWDNTALVQELREFDEDLLGMYFPDVDLEIQALNDVPVTDEDVAEAMKKVTTIKAPAEVHSTAVTCPKCAKRFEVRTDSLPGGAEAVQELSHERDTL